MGKESYGFRMFPVKMFLKNPATVRILVDKGMNWFIWLGVYLALWKMMEFVSWDDEIPTNYMEKSSSHVPVTTNQLYIYT